METVRFEREQAKVDELEARVERILKALLARKVVSILAIRRMTELRKSCQTEALMMRLRTAIADSARNMFQVFAPFLMEYLQSKKPPGDRPDDETVRRIAREVASNPWFRPANSRLRAYANEFTDVPWTHVHAHSRQGRNVEPHNRLLGNQHLLHLPLEGESEFVQRLVAALAALHPFSHRFSDGQIDNNRSVRDAL